MKPSLDGYQRKALVTMVEASRRVPEDVRPSFFYQHAFPDPHPTVKHPGLREAFHLSKGDIEVLSRAGLVIHRRQIHGCGNIDLTPAAFALYEKIQLQDGSPVTRLQEEIRAFLDAGAFRKRFSRAHDAWSKAAELLWAADHSTSQLSTIGHLCREAMQEFAAVLASAPQPPAPDPERTQTVARIRASLGAVRSSSDRAFLDALLTYWGTVSDLVQRQEHAGAKDGATLTWDDARRVVFQTALVMYEIAATQ